MNYPTKNDKYWLDNDYYWDGTSAEWYWNPNKNITDILDDPYRDMDMLLTRGEYLTEVIDKLVDSSLYGMMCKFPRDTNLAVSWLPGLGKTTIIRQYIVKHMSTTGIFATKRIDDVFSIYYDIVAQYQYLNPQRLGDQALFSKKAIFRYTSKDQPVLVNNEYITSKAIWIICTHKRLMVDPPTILYMNDINRAVINHKLLYRSLMIIDEYPTEFSIKLTPEEFMRIESLNNDAKARFDSEEDIDSIYLDALYSEVESENQSKRRKAAYQLDNVPLPTRGMLPTFSKSDHKLYEVNNQVTATGIWKAKQLRDRIYYFYQLMAHKLRNGEDIEDSYYSINDFPITTKWIFDGTADILFKNSKLWTTYDNEIFKRKLIINPKINLIRTNIRRRRTDFGTLIDNYIKVLNAITEDNSNKEIIVYTWKSSDARNGRDTSIIDILMNDDRLNNKDKLHFITYQSGNERVISKYKNSTVAVILGKFFIPHEVVDVINTLNKSKMTIQDYTKSLIIQFLYRSCLRVHDNTNQLKLYITNDYSENFIRDLISDCPYECKFEFYRIGMIDKHFDTSPNEIILNKIIDANEYIDYTVINNIIAHKSFTSYQLKDILGISRTSDITRSLDRAHISYEVQKTNNRHNPSIYTIGYNL